MPDTTEPGLDNIQIIDPRRHIPIAGIGPCMTFYFEGKGEDRGRKLIAKCADDYLNMFEEHIQKSVITCGRWRKTEKQTMDEFLQKKGCMEEVFSIRHGGSKDPEAFSHFNFRGGSPDKSEYEHRNKLNVISANSSVAALSADGKDSFIRWMLRWLEWLQPVHAYAGLGLQFPMYGRPEYLKIVYPYLMRFPGLDLDLPIHFADDDILTEHIKGAHWLTFLNPKHVARLGGVNRIIEALGDGFEVLEIAGGVLIQAGPSPRLGDVNQGIYPEFYYRLGKILPPIRYKEVISRNYIIPPNDDEDIAATQAWLARFDEGLPDNG